VQTRKVKKLENLNLLTAHDSAYLFQLGKIGCTN